MDGDRWFCTSLSDASMSNLPLARLFARSTEVLLSQWLINAGNSARCLPPAPFLTSQRFACSKHFETTSSCSGGDQGCRRPTLSLSQGPIRYLAVPAKLPPDQEYPVFSLKSRRDDHPGTRSSHVPVCFSWHSPDDSTAPLAPPGRPMFREGTPTSSHRPGATLGQSPCGG
jgi:hypothetical protein